MKKLLITGASGFLGQNLCQLAQPEWQIYGTYFAHTVNIPNANMQKVNLIDPQELTNIFNQIKPDAIIHTAAQSQPNYCQNHPEESHAINVQASKTLASLCADNSIPYVFTSTDLVFNGFNAPYKESDPVNPVNRYGEQKVIAEVEIIKRYPVAAICRMPLMFGTALPPASSFIQPFINTLQAGKELNLFSDEFRTPVSGRTAAQGLLLAVEKVQGIIHLGGKERISRYDFGKLLVDVFKLPADKLNSCLQQDVQMSAPRPADVSLDSSKAFKLGYSPLSLREELEMLASKKS